MRLPRPTTLMLALLAATPSLALEDQTIRRSGPQGQEVEIQMHYYVDSRCRPAAGLAISITRPPRHGHVEVREQTRRIDTRSTVGESTCLGREVTTQVVFYTPDQGYRGVDRFEYNRILPTDTRHVFVRVQIDPS